MGWVGTRCSFHPVSTTTTHDSLLSCSYRTEEVVPFSPSYEHLSSVLPFPRETLVLCLFGGEDGEQERSVVVPVRRETREDFDERRRRRERRSRSRRGVKRGGFWGKKKEEEEERERECELWCLFRARSIERGTEGDERRVAAGWKRCDDEEAEEEATAVDMGKDQKGGREL